jgi:peptidyl-tRNA hydrolase, PTH1 family
MGIIQKNPLGNVGAQYFTVGLNQTALIVGLGNVGDNYDKTRHNVGFACVDAFAQSESFDAWIEKKDLKCLYASKTLGANRVIIIKPTTLMNLSGEAVQEAMHYFKVELTRVLVVHDELDIPFGQLRMRTGGSDAGHNGIKSVTQHMGDAYGRVRVGIGPKTPEGIDSADFVLQRFSEQELGHMKDLTQEVNAIINEFIFGGELHAETRTFII